MISLKQLSILFIALFLIGGCETGGFASGPSEQRAESLARNQQHAEAADMYIGLATSASGSERDRLTMLAVEQWLDSGDRRRARSALQGVQKPTGGELLWLWKLDVAAIYLVEGRPDKALALLEPMSREPLTIRHRARAEALRADTWFQKNDPAQAVVLYMQRENWLNDSRDVERNRQRLWAGLLVSDPQVMRSAADVNVDPIVQGWLRLGALAASTGQQGIGWGNGVVRWQQTHAGHPAMAIVQAMDLPTIGLQDFPRQIALLLPVSGRNATAGKAVQNGFFGAYFAATSGLEEEQRVAVYDIASGGVAAAYALAIEDGAEFVVGPLTRKNVQALARESTLPVPVLSLNYLPNQQPAPPGFYQFALAPEDEAASAAIRARADGALKAVALYPNNDWGRRVMNSFAGELESRGGVLLDHRAYETGTQDFSIEIENLMALTQSVGRYKRLRANLDLPLQFDPRRRQDVDFVFLAADANAGRLIKSQLKFHYSGELPVYSTSFIYSMDGRSNSDLNGLMFADTPWIISPPPWIAGYPQLYAEFWPAEKRMGRLHAMGYDAYNLVGHLYSAGEISQQEFAGATGRLYMDNDGRIHRRLAWAKFEHGEPVPLPATDDLMAVPEEDASADEEYPGQPTEWPNPRLRQ